MAWEFLWRRRRTDRDTDLEDEVRGHLEMAIRDRVERGEPREAAARAARLEFGNVTQVKEITREMWGWGSFERLKQDLAYGLRMMRRNPGFTATAVVSLALGIGANTAMFTVVDAVLLRPLPYRQADRLVMVYSVGSFGPFSWDDGPFFDPEYLEFRKLNAFSDVAAVAGGEVSLNDDGEPTHVQRGHVTASLFPLLGAQAAIGRVFSDRGRIISSSGCRARRCDLARSLPLGPRSARPHGEDRWRSAHHHRGDARWIHVPAEGADLGAAADPPCLSGQRIQQGDRSPRAGCDFRSSAPRARSASRQHRKQCRAWASH